jgi:hypothetical protein
MSAVPHSGDERVTLSIVSCSSEADGYPVHHLLLPEDHKTWMLRLGQASGSAVLSLSPPSPVTAISLVNSGSSSVTLFAYAGEMGENDVQSDCFKGISEIPWQTLCPRTILRTEKEVGQSATFMMKNMVKKMCVWILWNQAWNGVH